MSFRLIPAGTGSALACYAASPLRLASLSYAFGAPTPTPVQLHGGCVVAGGTPRLASLDALCGFCRLSSAETVVLGFSESDTLSALCHALNRRGLRTVVPEAVWQESLSAACLVSSAVSGGTLRERLCDAKRKYGTVLLDLERISRRFSLPCADGCGTPVPVSTLNRARAVFSEELQCKVIWEDRGADSSCILFDDAESLRSKAGLAESCGITEGFALLSEWTPSDLL